MNFTDWFSGFDFPSGMDVGTMSGEWVEAGL